MKKLFVYRYMIMILFLITAFNTASDQRVSADEKVKEISVDQICGLYSDEPMSADSLYRNKEIKSNFKAATVKKIYSLCDDAPEGAFTVEFTTPDENVIQCMCNTPDQKDVLDTGKGATVNMQGTYQSMTATFFETESKQCTLTLSGCAFNP